VFSHTQLARGNVSLFLIVRSLDLRKLEALNHHAPYMQSDDDLQTTLSKWPFILGDVLLVATALAIAILGQWQLSNWQVASCVISVALGAGLFVLPYIVEFQVRVREKAEDHRADLRIFQRHLVSAEEQLEGLAKQVLGLAQVIDSKPSNEAIEALQAEFAALQAELVALQAELVALQAALVALQAKEAELPVQSVAAPAEEPVEVTSEDAEPSKSTEPVAKKTREPRQRRTAEPRLLQRAIEQKQDQSSQAVSRIINSEPKQPKAPELAEAPAPKVVEPEPEDMFVEAVPVEANKRTRNKKGDTAVIASVFIGIGNKPYVRGNGAGLNWENGVPMEFEEIGKWRWIAPADLEAPVELQLFRNDVDLDSSGKYTLEPGQKLELSPVFS